MKTIMILGGSASEVPVIKRAIDLGYKVIVVDRDENVPGFKVPNVITEKCSISDKEQVLDISKKYEIDGILPSVDAGVRTSAYVARELRLAGISERAAVLGTDKTEMRKELKKKGIPVPNFYIVDSYEEYLEAVSIFKDKCVVKAADSSGSRGIYLIKDVNQKEELKYAYHYCREYSNSGKILVEEFMEGLEICVETLNINGKCYPIQITDQMKKEPPYFIDCGYNQPSVLSISCQNEIKRIAVDANMALNNFQGSSCTEMIVTESGPKIVEIGVRLAGDFMTTKMVPLSNGVDMPGAVVQIALGENVNVEACLNKASCVRYFMKERIGKILDVIGIEQAYEIPGVVEVGVLKNIGEIATPLRKSCDRLGYVITQCETTEEAINMAEKAIELIEFLTMLFHKLI